MNASDLQSSVLDRLPHDIREQLMALAKVRELAPGERLLRQGQENADLFIVAQGALVVTREGTDENPAAVVATLGFAEIVGDMSVLRGARVSAHVDAAGPATVRVLSGAVLAAHPDLFAHLRASLGIAGLERLDTATRDIQARHARELHALEIQISATRFIVANFIALSFYMLSLPASYYYASILPVDSIVSLVFIVTFFAVAVRFLRSEGGRFKEYGITLIDWPGQLLRGFVWALPVLLLVVIAKAVFISGREAHLFDLMRSLTGEEISVPIVAGLTLAYTLLAFAQETVRCTMQKALEIFYSAGGKPAPMRAIGLTALAFSATHSHLGLVFAGVAGVGALYWAVVYRATGSYLAVSFNHGIIGAFAIFIVGAPK